MVAGDPINTAISVQDKTQVNESSNSLQPWPPS